MLIIPNRLSNQNIFKILLLINFTSTEQQLTMKEEAELKVIIRKYLTLRCITVQLQYLKACVLNAGCTSESPQEL